jgi:hypothetical protein
MFGDRDLLPFHPKTLRNCCATQEVYGGVPGLQLCHANSLMEVSVPRHLVATDRVDVTRKSVFSERDDSQKSESLLQVIGLIP